jgi:Saf4/Yju2 protein
MGERKVVSKYIPADFDPKLIPRGTKLSKKDGTVPVRMMLPFSVQCETCHTFLYRGRKFNSKKEAMGGPDGRYLGIQRWRFYIKCTHCARTLSFLTDPKNADYEMESGGTRNYEVYKDKAKTEEETAVEKEKEEKEDMMKALENRVLDSQREMADLDNLEEIKAMNKRHVQLFSTAEGGFDADARVVMASRLAKDEQAKKGGALNNHGTTEEEEAMIKSIAFGQTSACDVVRLSEEDEEREEKRRQQELARIKAPRNELIKSGAKTSIPIVKIKRKKVQSTAADKAPLKKSKGEAALVGLAGLMGGYGSDSDSD